MEEFSEKETEARDTVLLGGTGYDNIANKGLGETSLYKMRV